MSRLRDAAVLAGRFLVSDGLIVIGGGLIVYGFWMVSEPAGYIVAGAEFGLFGWFVGGTYFFA